ncbi:MAG: hypothetical protein OEX22_02605 [Cyclobacteriaceae bacterium]|nr:hypothetical protein [Cyclobacteriaceae bacterium]
MKLSKSIFHFLSLALILSMIMMSCDENPAIVTQQDLLPEAFGVDIPSSISDQTLLGGRTEADTLSGNQVYQHMNTFIAIGEGASDIVESIILAIRVHNIESLQVLSYQSDDDGRIKNMEVLENVEHEGITWEHQLTITDADSEANADGGKAMQVFWSSNPIKGIAIIKPFNIDRLHEAGAGEAIYRVDYSESGELGYDSHMEVSISNLPLADPTIDQYSMQTLRMFAGRKGDVVDVYGNSNHPNAKFFTEDMGFNWAFTASGSHASDVGAAEVGLPPSDLNNTNRTTLLEDYSIKNVFTRQIRTAWPSATQSMIDAYLHNTDAPGYFDGNGFMSAGMSPGAGWGALATRLKALTPYNPLDISNMVVTFK